MQKGNGTKSNKYLSGKPLHLDNRKPKPPALILFKVLCGFASVSCRMVGLYAPCSHEQLCPFLPSPNAKHQTRSQHVCLHKVAPSHKRKHPGDISAEILQTIHSMSYSSVQGLGFRVQGLGLLFLRSRVQGLVFRVQGLESIYDLGLELRKGAGFQGSRTKRLAPNAILEPPFLREASTARSGRKRP